MIDQLRSCAYIWTNNWDIGNEVILNRLAIQSVLELESIAPRNQAATQWKGERTDPGEETNNAHYRPVGEIELGMLKGLK